MCTACDSCLAWMPSMAGLSVSASRNGPDRAAGIAEIVLEAGHLEPPGDRVDHAHFLAPVWFLNGVRAVRNVRNKIRCSQCQAVSFLRACNGCAAEDSRREGSRTR